ncbi:MAG: hypothetical protein CGW95_07460 [Phenylobacterium zucineum]|nr:MAG: hypothetical protein CGW95_07460 [Phenylobacterium zucineum]
MSQTPNQTTAQRAEAELTAYGLRLPETDLVPGFGVTRYMRVAGKGFAVFGDKAETDNDFTLTVKLPISAEMVEDLWFVRVRPGWYKRNNWIMACFSPGDDVLAELPTLKAWMLQSYVAVAPKRLGKLVSGTFGEA